MPIVQQLMKYGLVAAISAISDWIVFSILLLLTGQHLPSQGAARLVGGGVSFFLNKHWSFVEGTGLLIVRSARRFLLLYAVSYVLSILALLLLVDVLGFWVVWGKLMADGMMLVFNFTVMRVYVFNKRDGITAGIRLALPSTRSKSL